MRHGCTDPSSTWQPYMFAITLHAPTDAIGASTTKAMNPKTIQ